MRRAGSGLSRWPPTASDRSEEKSVCLKRGSLSQLTAIAGTAQIQVTRSRSISGKTVSASGDGASTIRAPSRIPDCTAPSSGKLCIIGIATSATPSRSKPEHSARRNEL